MLAFSIVFILALVVPGGALAAPGKELVHVAPTILYRGEEAPHVCFQEGSYREGDLELPAEPLFCFFILAPLSVWSGDEIRVETPIEAKTLATQYWHRGPVGGLRNCRGIEPGQWECHIPQPEDDVMALRVDITYPDAHAAWNVDFGVRPARVRCGGTTPANDGAVASHVRGRYVVCSRALRVARRYTAHRVVRGWSCSSIGRRRIACRKGARSVVRFVLSPRPVAVPWAAARSS